MDATAESGDRNTGEVPMQPANAKDAVYAMLGSQLRTTLSDGRVVEGRLQCMDRLTNFILADAVETGTAIGTAVAGEEEEGRRRGDGGCGDGSVGKDEGENGTGSDKGSCSGQKPGAQQRHLGVVMIPGKHLVSVQRLGKSGGPK